MRHRLELPTRRYLTLFFCFCLRRHKLCAACGLTCVCDVRVAVLQCDAVVVFMAVEWGFVHVLRKARGRRGAGRQRTEQVDLCGCEALGRELPLHD